MSIAHSFMRIHIHRACFMSIARYEHSSYFGPMYEHSSYYDNGFIIDELMLYLIMLSCFHDPYCTLGLPDVFAILETKYGTMQL